MVSLLLTASTPENTACLVRHLQSVGNILSSVIAKELVLGSPQDENAYKQVSVRVMASEACLRAPDLEMVIIIGKELQKLDASAPNKLVGALIESLMLLADMGTLAGVCNMITGYVVIRVIVSESYTGSAVGGLPMRG